MNRQHRKIPFNDTVVVGTTTELADEASRGVVAGRLYVNSETEVAMVQLPSGALQVLKTTDRPEQPDALSKPLISGLISSPGNQTIMLHASGSVQSFITPNTEINYYWYEGYTLIHVGPTLDVTPQFPDGTTITFGVRAIDDFNNTSLESFFTVTTGPVPEVRPFMDDLPERLQYGETGTFYIDPGTDSLGAPYTAIVHSNDLLTITGTTTFDVTTWMTYVATSNYSLFGDSNNLVELQRNGVTVINESVSAFVGVENNQPPNANTITSTLPNPVYTGETFTFAVFGAIDPEGQVITYTVTSLDSDITLTDATDIYAGDIITGVVNSDPNIAPKSVAFNVIATDIMGAQSGAKVLTTRILTDRNIIFDTSQFIHDFVNTETVNTSTDHLMGGMTVTLGGVLYPVQYRAVADRASPPANIIPNQYAPWAWTSVGSCTIDVTPFIGGTDGPNIAIIVPVVTDVFPPDMSGITGVPSVVNKRLGYVSAITGITDPEGGIITLTWTVSDIVCQDVTGPSVLGGNIVFHVGSTPTCIIDLVCIATSAASGLSSSQVFQVESRYVPDLPDLSGLTGVPSSIVAHSADCYVIGGAIDPEGGSLTYSILSNDPGCVGVPSADFMEGACIIHTAGPNVCNTIINVSVTNDYGVTLSKNFNISVIAQQPPNVVNLTGVPTSILVNSNDCYPISGATDPEGGILTYSMTSANPVCVTVPGTNFASGACMTHEGGPVPCSTIITVAVTSDDGLTTTRDFGISVVDHQPIDMSGLTGVPNTILVMSNDCYNIGGAVDPEGGVLTYNISSANQSCVTVPTATFANNDCIYHTASITPCSTVITVTATTDDGLTATKDFNISVINHADINMGALTGVPSSILVDSSDCYNIGGAIDPEGGALTYSIASASTSCVTVPSTNFVDGTCITHSAGSTPCNTIITVTATTTHNVVATKDFSIAVVGHQPLNMSGLTGVPSSILVDSNQCYNIGGAVDPEGGVVSYSIASANSGCVSVTSSTFADNDCIVHGAGPAPCSTIITVTAVTDDGVTATKDFGIAVVNHAAINMGALTGVPSSVIVGSSQCYNIGGAIDPEGGILTYTMSSANSGCVAVPSTTFYDNACMTHTAGPTVCNTAITVTAETDDGVVASKVFGIAVVAQQPPNVSGITGLPTTMDNNETIYLVVGGIVDPEGGTISFTVSTNNCVSTPVTTYNLGGSVSYTSTMAGGCTSAGVLVATSSASGLSTTHNFSIAVSPAGNLDLSGLSGVPTVLAGGGNTINSVVSGGYDPEGGTISYTSSTGACLTLSPSSFNDGGNVNFAAAGGACIGSTITTTLTGTSSASGFSASKSFSTVVSAGQTLDASTMVIVTPSTVSGLAIGVSFVVYGVLDSTGGTNVTYTIASVSPTSKFSFGTPNNFANNVNNPYNVANPLSTTVIVQVFATDYLGATSANRSVSVIVSDDPTTSGITMSLPDPLTIGTNYSFYIQGGTDPNGDTLSHMTTVPANTSVFQSDWRPSGTTRTFTALGTPRNVTFNVSIRDSLGNTGGSTTFTRTLISGNSPPDGTNMVLSGDTALVPSGVGNYSFTPASDPDGDTLTYLITTTGAMAPVSQAKMPNTSFPLAAASYTGNGYVTVTASDPYGLSVSKSMTVVVAANNPPDLTNAVITDPWILCETNPVSLTGAVEPDGDIMEWKMIVNESTIVINSQDANWHPIGSTINYTPVIGVCSKFWSGDTQNIRVTVRDSHGLQTTKDFVITMQTNPPVVLNCVTTLTAARTWMWTNETMDWFPAYPCAPHQDGDLKVGNATGMTSTALYSVPTGQGQPFTSGGAEMTGSIKHHMEIGIHSSAVQTKSVPIVNGMMRWGSFYTDPFTNILPLMVEDTGFTKTKFVFTGASSAQEFGWHADVTQNAVGLPVDIYQGGSNGDIEVDINEYIRMSTPPMLMAPYKPNPSSSTYVCRGTFFCHIAPWQSDLNISFVTVEVRENSSSGNVLLLTTRTPTSSGDLQPFDAWIPVVHTLTSGETVWVRFSYRNLDRTNAMIGDWAVHQVSNNDPNDVSQHLIGYDDCLPAYTPETSMDANAVNVDIQHDHYAGSVKTFYAQRRIHGLTPTDLYFNSNPVTYDGGIGAYTVTIPLSLTGGYRALDIYYGRTESSGGMRNADAQLIANTYHMFLETNLDFRHTGDFHNIVNKTDCVEWVRGATTLPILNDSVSEFQWNNPGSRTAGDTLAVWISICTGAGYRKDIRVIFLAV